MTALLFPGQGSQQPGMGQFLYSQFRSAQLCFEEASESIKVDLKRLCFEGSVEDLALTENTQPCLLTNSVATFRVLEQEFGLKPSIALGHSIGEYGALVAAGCTSFYESVKTVKLRGQFMQEAVPQGQGSMLAALGLTDVQAGQLCEYVVKESGRSPLSPANFNSPGQIVLSGNAMAIKWLTTNFKAEMLWPENTPRFKGIQLQVSAPFHCQMMKPAEEKMRIILQDLKFNDARFPIIQNFTAKAETKSAVLRENLIRQVSAPVLWTQSVNELKAKGISKCIELGAGKVLQGLLKKIDSEFFQVLNTNSLEDLKNIETSLRAETQG